MYNKFMIYIHIYETVKLWKFEMRSYQINKSKEVVMQSSLVLNKSL